LTLLRQELSRAGEDGKEDRRQDGDDRNDHEQFDQGKAASHDTHLSSLE
jgi:hypothetical protein